MLFNPILYYQFSNSNLERKDIIELKNYHSYANPSPT